MGHPHHKKDAWTDPQPGTHMHAIMTLMLRPQGWESDRNNVGTIINHLRDMCGYDIRIIGKAPGAFRQRPGFKMDRCKRSIYRIVGRVGFHLNDPYEDYLARDLAIEPDQGEVKSAA